MKTVVEIVLVCTAVLNIALSRFALFRLQQPGSPFLWFVKVFVSGTSPVLLLIGLITTLGGWLLGSLPVMMVGGLSALVYLIHIIAVTRAPETSPGWEGIFRGFQNFLSGNSNSFFIPTRDALRLPDSPEPILHKDITFHTIHGTDRRLLCDVWQPASGIKNSGLAFIYFHGSAWTVLDKDYGTRTLFRRLAAQGHVTMDVAYRLFPETDLMGMVHDAKHAIAWMKANAERYGADASMIVIGGGSAGGHLALLGAYTNRDQQLTPLDLKNVDLNVRGVISLYGPSDLTAVYYHTCQHLITNDPNRKDFFEMPAWMQKKMGKDFYRLGFDKKIPAGRLVPMLGGTPDEKPEAYAYFSPIAYVHADCPHTVLIHGKHDCLVPVESIRRLYARLTEARVPAAIHILPQTDHAFDLILPKISPSAHNAIYDVERSLAAIAHTYGANHSNKLSKASAMPADSTLIL